MNQVTHHTVTADEDALRLDRWFKKHFPLLGHGALEKLLRTGQIRVDGHRAKAGLRLESGQVLRVPPLPEHSMMASVSTRPPALFAVSAADSADLQKRVLYRDADVLVLNKPPGLAVQGGTDTIRHLDAMLDALCFEATERPRLVHRLDKDTSGVLILARHAGAARYLAAAFRDKSARKLYWAITAGVPQPYQGLIDIPLSKQSGIKGERVALDEEDGQRSITQYQVMEHAGRNAAFVLLSPLTGRTHQLRVHMAHVAAPILGDGKYGGKAAFLDSTGVGRGLHLHARRLILPLPHGGTLDVTAPAPPHFVTSGRWLGFNLSDCGTFF